MPVNAVKSYTTFTLQQKFLQQSFLFKSYLYTLKITPVEDTSRINSAIIQYRQWQKSKLFSRRFRFL
ncbi:hypothetical protein CS542_06875 [Pedobacter sp. IW39]|nr:hypothetical protein CS542_06875 [Pedobacter sp. IW39]